MGYPQPPRPSRVWAGAALLLVACTLASANARGEPAYVVIVHPTNPVNEIDRATLARFFLKKITRWPDSSAVRPVDLYADAVVRRDFAEEILGRSVGAVRAYWQQAIFSGRNVPPPELASQAEVIAFVLANDGAIGYVARSAHLQGAKVVALR